MLTHCNAGALATAGYGTALGVIRAAAEQGKVLQVSADETRPFLQGARLTAWELVRDLGGRPPDVVAVPVGSGRLIAGVWKGFRELGELGWIEQLPRIVACQPAAADVLTEPWRQGAQTPLAKYPNDVMCIGVGHFHRRA